LPYKEKPEIIYLNCLRTTNAGKSASYDKCVPFRQLINFYQFFIQLHEPQHDQVQYLSSRDYIAPRSLTASNYYRGEERWWPCLLKPVYFLQVGLKNSEFSLFCLIDLPVTCLLSERTVKFLFAHSTNNTTSSKKSKAAWSVADKMEESIAQSLQ
jgi:hypothetical protein